MDTRKKQFVIWTTIAGILFLIVAANDLWIEPAVDKSRLVIGMELVTGVCFVANGLIHWWRRS